MNEQTSFKEAASDTSAWPHTDEGRVELGGTGRAAARPPHDPYRAVRDGLKGVMGQVEAIYDFLVPLLTAGLLPCPQVVKGRLLELHEGLGRARIALLPLSGR